MLVETTLITNVMLPLEMRRYCWNHICALCNYSTRDSTDIHELGHRTGAATAECNCGLDCHGKPIVHMCICGPMSVSVRILERLVNY